MAEVELFYRRCNFKEALASKKQEGLVIGCYNGHEVHGIPVVNCPRKNVFTNVREASNYSPKGVLPSAYAYCVVFRTVAGTIDALRKDVRDGSEDVMRVHQSGFSLSESKVKWFNNRVIDVDIFDSCSGWLPKQSSLPTINLLQTNSGSFALFMALSQLLIECGERNLKLSDKFSLKRMTWLKTSLLWTLWRSNWSTKQNQERLVMITVTSDYILNLIDNAVSTKVASPANDVLFQKDPDRRIISWRFVNNVDHFVLGGTTIHFGLRGEFLRRFASDIFPFHSEDITKVCTDILQERQLHPTHELYERLGLTPRSFSLMID